LKQGPKRFLPAPRTLYRAKVLRNQLVGSKMIFFHVCFTVGVML
jgi:hypothetical protein